MKRPCHALTKEGNQCRTAALPDSAYCWLHGLSDEQRTIEAARAARARWAKQRSRALTIADDRDLPPPISLADAVRVCLPALTATFAHDGSPDWGARLAAVAVLAILFPRLRGEPDELRELLSSARLSQASTSNVYTALDGEWTALQGRAERDPAGDPIAAAIIGLHPAESPFAKLGGGAGALD